VTRSALLFTLIVGLPVLAATTWAQQSTKVPVVGLLAIAAGPKEAVFEALRDGLRELGYVEGRNLKFEHRSAEGHLDRLASMAEELVRLKVDVIVTGTDPATHAAQQATSTIPIVVVLPDDPVAAGFIESFNHPGGNITGLTVRNNQLAAKRLQLLKEILPGLSRIIALFSDPLARAEVEQMKPVARSLGIELQLVEVNAPYDFDGAFSTAKRQKAGAVMLLGPQVYVRRFQLGALALKRGLLAESPFHDLTRAGGLMSYSTDFRDGFYRSAYYVDRLLKGAKPSDLPFEQTANIKFVVNLKTADALGISIPQSILLRADEVIR
jgi:putative ABC transport system substrate-binding protein